MRQPGCDPEVATLNSSWELTVGSSSKEKRTVTKGVTVAAAAPNLSGHGTTRDLTFVT